LLDLYTFKLVSAALANPRVAESKLPGVEPSTHAPPFSQLALNPNFQLSAAA